jgi:UDP-N-acetylglucosamine acyltransferase
MADVRVLSDIAPEATIHPDAEVGQWCVIGPNVTIGPHTRLLSHVTVLGHTTIGADNLIESGSVIGGEPQDKKYGGGPTRLVIGDRNRIGRNVTVNIGTELGGWVTYVGNDNILGDSCHVAHDCFVTDNVHLHCKVLLAGHIVIHPGAVVESMTGVQHFVRLGRYSRVGMRTPVRRDVPPYVHYYSLDYYWDPPQIRGIHEDGIEAAALSATEAAQLRSALAELFDDPAALASKLDAVEATHRSEEVSALCRFCRESLEGTYGRYRERFRNTAPPEIEQYLPQAILDSLKKEVACL